MAIRHILLAGLVGAASLAHAAPTTQTSSSIVAGWTLEKGSIDVLGELDAVQIMLAQGKNANWNQHAQLANGKLQLFSLNAATPALAVSSGSSGASQQVGGSGNAVGPGGSGPNNPSVLPNGVLTGGNSDPLSVPNSMKGGDSAVTPGRGASAHDGAGAGPGASAEAHDRAGAGAPDAAGSGVAIDAVIDAVIDAGGGITIGGDAAGELAAGGTASAGALIDEAANAGTQLGVSLDALDAPAAAAIPEPATGALLLAGLMGSVLARRRRTR